MGQKFTQNFVKILQLNHSESNCRPMFLWGFHYFQLFSGKPLSVYEMFLLLPNLKKQQKSERSPVTIPWYLF